MGLFHQLANNVYHSNNLVLSISVAVFTFHLILFSKLLLHLQTFLILALGVIGEVNNRITEAVVWALRFEAQPGVRAEACGALVRLGIKGKEISTILQDKLLVELDPVVRK